MWVTDDGIQLSAVLERPDENRCPLVIFLHGFTSTKDRPHNMACCAAMRSAGFATLRMDLYGHGESGGTFGKHTLYKWISNTMAAIEYARHLDFVTDIYLSGHSQGGLTASIVAGMEPDRIRGLILRAPAFLIPEGSRKGHLLGFDFDPMHVPDAVEIAPGLMLEGSYVRVAQTIRVEEAMDRFRGPVLMIHGEKDETVPVEDSVKAAQRYRQCRLEIIPGESHHFDRNLPRTEEIIREWLLERQREDLPREDEGGST